MVAGLVLGEDSAIFQRAKVLGLVAGDSLCLGAALFGKTVTFPPKPLITLNP